LEHKDALPLRAFPKTGTHWSRAAAFFTITELLKTIERESGREMPPLSQSIEIIDHQPDYADADLANLLNIIERPHQRYLHPNFQIPVNWPKRKGILTIVGGSFVWEMASALDAARVFERLNVYYYFKVFRRQFPGEIESPVDENAIPWEEDFWNTRAVVLEGNEAAINGRHMHAFLMAGLSVLQQRMPQKQGAPEPPSPFSWGFGAGENGTALQKKGFSVPDHQLTWVTNQYADIDLPSPGANTDIQLILEALPVLAEGVSGRTVAVEVNGIPVGSLWLWRPDIRFYSLTINATANSAPLLKLHFSISPEPSPVAGSGQPREIGLARLALVPTGHSTDQAIGENNGIIGHGLVPGPGR